MEGKIDVWAAAEEFRSKYTELNSLPIDIFWVAEVKMKLDIIPFPNLFSQYSVDAAITPDFEGIYVDERAYLELERHPAWRFDRLRFSLAHEIGHIVLHKSLVSDQKFKSVEEWWAWMRKYNDSRYDLEQQANEFGGRILVPVDRLKAEFDQFVAGSAQIDTKWWNNTDLQNALLRRLSGIFLVNPEVIRVRLDREELWGTG